MRKTKRVQSVVITSLLLLFALPNLFAATPPLPFNRIEVYGNMPKTEFFRVEQNVQVLDFNLVESRNSIVLVGTYTLISNNTASHFRLTIRPGEDGMQDQFAFNYERGQPLLDGQLSELPFTIRVTSDTSRGTSVGGSKEMAKELGVRGGFQDNGSILYESGDILAEIPDFNPDRYATGRYSAALHFTIDTI